MLGMCHQDESAAAYENFQTFFPFSVLLRPKILHMQSKQPTSSTSRAEKLTVEWSMSSRLWYIVQTIVSSQTCTGIGHRTITAYYPESDTSSSVIGSDALFWTCYAGLLVFVLTDTISSYFYSIWHNQFLLSTSARCLACLIWAALPCTVLLASVQCHNT